MKKAVSCLIMSFLIIFPHHNYYIKNINQLDINREIEIRDGVIVTERDDSRSYNGSIEDFLNREYAERMKKFIPLITVLSFIWIIIVLVLLIILFIRDGKRSKELTNLTYCRSIDYNPSLVEYIISGKLTDKSFTATILELIDKGVLRVEKLSNDYRLILQNNNIELSKGEEIVLNLLINIIGNKKTVNLSSLKNYCNTYNNSTLFMREYNHFIMVERKKMYKEHIYTRASLVAIILIFTSLIGIILALTCFGFKIWYLTIILTFILSISICYILSLRFFTKSGFEKYKQCLGYKKFLEDFSRFDEKELLEVSLWDKHIVYGVVLDCTDTLNEQLLIRFPNMFNDYNITSDFYTSINKDIKTLVNPQENTK